ncbi:unnamed protein product [Paramecium primaurelia]|uniref:Transmembrane protein n=1 Tax=Paramecium primaurelia TaxID=5886 RepID=A0A8S1KGK8_PARPR|nr:unnamed protein product [Paramecium primaurelia]
MQIPQGLVKKLVVIVQCQQNMINNNVELQFTHDILGQQQISQFFSLKKFYQISQLRKNWDLKLLNRFQSHIIILIIVIHFSILRRIIWQRQQWTCSNVQPKHCYHTFQKIIEEYGQFQKKLRIQTKIQIRFYYQFILLIYDNENIKKYLDKVQGIRLYETKNFDVTAYYAGHLLRVVYFM